MLNKSLCLHFHLLVIELNCKVNCCNSYTSVFLSIVVRSESSRNAIAGTYFIFYGTNIFWIQANAITK